MPSGGRITRLRWPTGPFVRVDSHCYAGYDIPGYYDSLLASHRLGTRSPEALKRMKRALRELEIEGVETTVCFHQGLVEEKDFTSGAFATSYLEEKEDYFSRYYKGGFSSLDQAKVSSITAALAVLDENEQGEEVIEISQVPIGSQSSQSVLMGSVMIDWMIESQGEKWQVRLPSAIVFRASFCC